MDCAPGPAGTLRDNQVRKDSGRSSLAMTAAVLVKCGGVQRVASRRAGSGYGGAAHPAQAWASSARRFSSSRLTSAKAGMCVGSEMTVAPRRRPELPPAQTSEGPPRTFCTCSGSPGTGSGGSRVRSEPQSLGGQRSEVSGQWSSEHNRTAELQDCSLRPGGRSGTEEKWAVGSTRHGSG